MDFFFSFGTHLTVAEANFEQHLTQVWIPEFKSALLAEHWGSLPPHRTSPLENTFIAFELKSESLTSNALLASAVEI